jgi:hypothetical protein
VASEDDEVICANCGECFVEMIEDPSHLQQLQTIYKEEQKQEASRHEPPMHGHGQQEWLTNITGNIEEIMRNHGESRTVN